MPYPVSVAIAIINPLSSEKYFFKFYSNILFFKNP